MPQPEGQPSIAHTAAIVAWAAWAAFAVTWAGVSTAVWWRTGDLGSFVGGGAVVALFLLIPAGLTFTVWGVDRPARSSPLFDRTFRQPKGTDMTAIFDPCPPPDAANYPYAQDLNGVWHRRPDGDEWIVTNDGPNCHTACGEAIPSVHVSSYHPDELDAGEARCACCTEVAS